MQTNTTVVISKDHQRDGQIRVTNLRTLRFALIKKYGSLSTAAKSLDVDYINLSHVINGRLRLIYIVSAIQEDLGLTDAQVLEFWPLLRTWPRESRRVV